jgi:hypothetical protein
MNDVPRAMYYFCSCSIHDVFLCCSLHCGRCISIARNFNFNFCEPQQLKVSIVDQGSGFIQRAQPPEMGEILRKEEEAMRRNVRDSSFEGCKLSTYDDLFRFVDLQSCIDSSWICHTGQSLRGIGWLNNSSSEQQRIS